MKKRTVNSFPVLSNQRFCFGLSGHSSVDGTIFRIQPYHSKLFIENLLGALRPRVRCGPPGYCCGLVWPSSLKP
jgi:hypothetical protein